MSSSGLQNFDPVVSSNASERKQGDGSSLQKANLDECGVAHEQESKRFTETGQLSPFLDETEEEMAEDFKPPPSKKRLVEKPLLLENSEAPPQAWSQDPLFNCDQYSESQIYQTDENFTTPKCLSGAEMAFFDGLRSEDAFGSVMDVKGRTSTQKPDFTSSISEDEEDDGANGSKSRRSTVSHFKSNCKQSETENILHQKQSSEPDENTMANLFTQDSEGFRVISHRGRQPRSPLRDQSNLVTGMVRTCKSFQEEDDDEEMLFTQDSQGNLVIKH
uniref:Uncharacterized protein n=1 Tax=Oryzias sinensis TaxID=183150 RepID=A0A8C7X6I1_9TELE